MSTGYYNKKQRKALEKGSGKVSKFFRRRKKQKAEI